MILDDRKDDDERMNKKRYSLDDAIVSPRRFARSFDKKKRCWTSEHCGNFSQLVLSTYYEEDFRLFYNYFLP